MRIRGRSDPALQRNHNRQVPLPHSQRHGLLLLPHMSFGKDFSYEQAVKPGQLQFPLEGECRITTKVIPVSTTTATTEAWCPLHRTRFNTDPIPYYQAHKLARLLAFPSVKEPLPSFFADDFCSEDTSHRECAALITSESSSS